MKKILLLMALVSFVFTNAQNTCATAAEIGVGTQTITAIDGTEVTPTVCITGGTMTNVTAAEWYHYTAAVDGVAEITTDLTVNAGRDTRFHVYTGSCGALTCVGGADDISTTNYLGTYQFTINAGDTFYIVFDNRWESNGFDFQITETEIPCIVPTGLTARVTDSSATVMWTSNDDETLWNIEYGPTGFSQGDSTATLITDHTSTSYDITTTASTSYDVYVQANCGATDGVSSWQGPYKFTTLAAQVDCGLVIPSNSFENGLSCSGDVHQAADFIVPMGSDVSLTQITPSVLINNADTIVSVNVKVYDDNGGLPGNLVSTQDSITPTSSNVTGTAFTSFNVTDLVLDLTPVTLNGSTTQDTRYWVAINVLTTDTANTSYWETTSASIVGLPEAGSADGTENSYLLNDMDCVFTFIATCSVASVNEDVLASQVSIYPTSTNDSFTINNKSNTALTSVSLFDVNGRVVLNQNLENLIGEKSINVSNLSTGMYFVQLNTANATVTKKLIKN